MEEDAETRKLFQGATELTAWEPYWKRHYAPEYVPTGDEVWAIMFDSPGADDVISGSMVFLPEAGRHPADLVDLPGHPSGRRNALECG